MLKITDRVKLKEDDMTGEVMERYSGTKWAMKGMVYIKWDGGMGYTWESPDDLVLLATPDPTGQGEGGG